MHISDIIYYHSRPYTRDFPEGWWLLPAVLLGAAFWAVVIYAIVT
jgi:hypothetical protein